MWNVFVNENTTAQRIDEHLNTNRYMPLRGIYVRHECVKCENILEHNFRTHGHMPTHSERNEIVQLWANVWTTLLCKQ